MAKFYIRNMEDGPRDYPLKDGTSVYLEPRGKPVRWAEISSDNFSAALERAEEKGFIQVRREASETAKAEAKTQKKAAGGDVNG